MVIVDTSYWIHHFRKAKPIMTTWEENKQIVLHALVLQELSLGHLKAGQILMHSQNLRIVHQISHGEFLHFVNSNRLNGKGIGVVDAHILASTILEHAALATLDVNLTRVAKSLGVVVFN